jgi:1-acyl-sn-glycerol-3-phosphate acyltransferase
MIKKLLLQFSILYKIWFLLYFIVTLIIFFPFFYLLLSNEKFFPKAFALKKIWANVLCIGAGIIYKTKYNMVLDKNKTYIFCCNHTSYVDIIITYCIIDNYFVFMGKRELGNVPLFLIFFKKMNILVDRKSITDAHKAFVRAGEEIDKGNSIIIFPEGTISREAPKMRPFKNGAFKLAIEKQIDIVPITFINVWKRLKDTPFLQGTAGPGITNIVLHKSVSTVGLTNLDVDSLKNKVKEIIQTAL